MMGDVCEEEVIGRARGKDFVGLPFGKGRTIRCVCSLVIERIN
jgi:hypothetical protein